LYQRKTPPRLGSGYWIEVTGVNPAAGAAIHFTLPCGVNRVMA